MSPVTHFLSGWVFANCFDLDRRDRTLITWAAVVPDLDGLGAVPEILTRNSDHPWTWFSQYHHSLHTLWFALFCAILAMIIARRRWITGVTVFAAFHIHLLGDLLGARGPDGYAWPITYLWPIRSVRMSWSGEWPLNSWQNLVITLALLVISVWIIRVKGRSPVEPFSLPADRAVVTAFRKRMNATI
jgi:inner membrane protein